jgi:hypothetical protein
MPLLLSSRAGLLVGMAQLEPQLPANKFLV